MKLITYCIEGQSSIGIIFNETKIIPLGAAEQKYLGTSTLNIGMLDLVKGGESFIEKISTIYDKVKEDEDPGFLLDMKDVKLAAPIPRPEKNIFCLGKNYRAHAFEFEKTAEEKVAIPKNPIIFTKNVTAVIGPDDEIKSHSEITQELDYEVELAVVIGKGGTNIPRETAMDHIFGYTIINDITARDLQRTHVQWHRAKSLDTFAPMGPYLVHKSSVPSAEDLEVICKVNGEIRQKANTKDLIFDIPSIISILSDGMTLEPGDIIATGTPAGVGMGFDPPEFLKPGDIVEMEISHLGVLRNTVI